MQGQFTIIGENHKPKYEVHDEKGSPFLHITVTTTDYAGTVKIAWPTGGVYPDNTDPLLKDATGNSCNVVMEAQSEYTFKFFKSNPQDVYTADFNEKDVLITIRKISE